MLLLMILSLPSDTLSRHNFYDNGELYLRKEEWGH